LHSGLNWLFYFRTPYNGLGHGPPNHVLYCVTVAACNISIYNINLLPVNDVPLQLAKYSVVLPQITDNVRAVTKLLFTHDKDMKRDSTPFSRGMGECMGQQMHISYISSVPCSCACLWQVLHLPRPHYSSILFKI
jgi:hypothetical protein